MQFKNTYMQYAVFTRTGTDDPKLAMKWRVSKRFANFDRSEDSIVLMGYGMTKAKAMENLLELLIISLKRQERSVA